MDVKVRLNIFYKKKKRLLASIDKSNQKDRTSRDTFLKSITRSSTTLHYWPGFFFLFVSCFVLLVRFMSAVLFG